MKILLSNDDGVHAQGINVLKEILDELGEVIIIAPLEERSATGQAITLDRPLRLLEMGPNIYGCSGYPADCVIMGLDYLLKDNPPDIVISGINRGANMGQDTYYSGTVAAAREAAFHQIPSIAVSTVVDFKSLNKRTPYYEPAANFIKKLIELKGHHLIEQHRLININVPDLPQDQIKGPKLTRPGLRMYSKEIKVSKDYRNRPYYWNSGEYIGFTDIEDSDCNALDLGHISVTIQDPLNHSDISSPEWESLLKTF